MFLLYLFFWAIALFIFINEFRTTADIWVAISFFLFGFGGVSAALQEWNHNLWILAAAAASIELLWGPYGLLMYSLHYTGKMPEEKMKRWLIEIIFAIPLISFYILIPAMQMFGLREPDPLQSLHMRIMIGIVTPYFIGVVALLTIRMFKRNFSAWRSEIITSYILIVPLAIAYCLTNFFAYRLGYNDIEQVKIVIVIVESILFYFLVTRKNAFGLFYCQQNETREQLERSAVEGTNVLQHAMKNNLAIIRLALQNAQYYYAKDDNNSEAIKNELHLALDSCTHSLSILNSINLKIYPVRLSLECSTLLPIIEQVIHQSHAEYAEKEIKIITEVQSNPCLRCDPVHIREAILNLINNAMEATTDDGQGLLIITLLEYKGKAILQIKDNGCGIEKGRIKRIGFPMATTKSNGTHYGLGLYYVKKVIEMHKGQFSIRKSPNGGMVAEVMLPVIRDRKHL